MNKFGIHLPNGPIRDPETMLELGSHFTLLHFQAAWVPKLREVSPDGVILVRFYLPKWSERDPREWARACAEEYLRDRGGWSLASLGCDVTPANEQNLPHEGGGWTADWYRRINEWNLAWLDEFRRRTGCPRERTHFPAFAYGHSDDTNDLGHVGLEICRQAIEAYGVLDYHPYWFEPDQVESEWHGHRFVQAWKLFPGKPIFCSEAGNFAVERASTPEELLRWFNSLYRYPHVIGGTPFIYEDPTGAHRPNDWSRNPEIARRIAAATKPAVERSGAGVWPDETPNPRPRSPQTDDAEANTMPKLPEPAMLFDGIPLYDVRDAFPEVHGNYDRRDPKTITELIVHHSATRQPTSVDDTFAVAQAIQSYHTGTHGWPAIGYHFVASPQAILWVNGLDVVSAHTLGANERSVGLCLLGNYEHSALEAWMRRTVRAVLTLVQGQTGNQIALYGHAERNPRSTEFCPSQNWLDWKRQLLQPADQTRASVLAEFDAVWGNLDEIEQRIAHVRNHVIRAKKALGYE